MTVDLLLMSLQMPPVANYIQIMLGIWNISDEGNIAINKYKIAVDNAF